MLTFLQGFAIGLAIMSGPWLLAGLFKPEWVLPDLKPNRFKVFLRYGMAMPFVSLLLALTSLWGGFGPSLLGWLSGLGALFVAVPIERQIRQFLFKRKLQRSTKLHREQLDVNLERDAENTQADPIVKQLNAIRTQLVKLKLYVEVPERFYSRYVKLQTVLSKRFDPEELAMQRSQTLIKDVYKSSLKQMDSLIDILQQLELLDLNYIQHQLSDPSIKQVAKEALLQRRQLAEKLNLELNNLLAEFEKTLTALDATRLKLSELGRSTVADKELDQVLASLEKFNQRLTHY